ncbi:MAG: endonuclease MutS2 [Oscillospiraceae bacterium]|jgi:DNA mismatch repair protein MutS2|nr:endonuclease MutS2 [Oscillospiraceae bacterium]
MTELTDKSIVTLELPKVLETLASFAVSDEAKERCLALRPALTLREATERLLQTGAARAMLETRGAPALSGIRPVAPALQRTQMGGVLNTRELLDIASVLRAARTARAYHSSGARGAATAIDTLFARLTGDKQLEDRITGCILSEEEIADHATPELASIRRHMRAAAGKIKDILNRMIATHGKYLQDALITQRAGRYVIPVKAEHRGDVPGLLHDVSSSGATLFIEPMAAVQADNDLREWEAKEKKEIERLLAELSADCDGSRDVILEDYDALVALDAVFARGRLASEQNASAPVLNDRGVTSLLKARHPLLDKHTAVPISVWLGKGFDTLVVTGPNTGGKTVTLKTLGLLTLMAACGLQIPAGDGSEVAVTGKVYADIGDEQSIAQSLSTFSSHMTNIVAILKEAEPGSLILFDELGAGTDPVEGAALAVAIIEEARRHGCRVAATTHYAELKTYAMTTEGVANACCEFDVETLRPTYRLLIGIPGRSNAFAISSRLGLSESVIEAAKERVGIRDAALEDVLAQLERQRIEMENDRASAERAKIDSEADRSRAEELRRRIEREYEKAAEKARSEARRILDEARAAADGVSRELTRIKQTQAQEELPKLRQRLREAEDALGGGLPAPPEPEVLFGAPPPPGTEVILISTGTKATVLAGADRNGLIPLQAGIMKVTVPLDGIKPLDEKKKKPKAGGGVSVSQTPEPAAIELDLRGQLTDDGVLMMEQFIDNAVMRKLSTVTVIHGKGTGAMRTAVHAALRKNKSVKGFRLGKYGEGETGVTVVTL